MQTQDNNVLALSSVSEVNDMLTDVLRQGAQQMLAAAVDAEVHAFLSQYEHIRDIHGRKQVVRNGYLPERTIQTGLGSVDIKVPRVRDNSGNDIAFTSALLPPYLKRTQSISELLPWLYLKGISTGGFADALRALLGKEAKGLSANTICRLKASLINEYQAWTKRDLSKHNIVYIWVDGVYLQARMQEKQCMLVIIGADDTGKKHVLAISDGYRESTQSWREVLLDLKHRGLPALPKLAVGDGALGFWQACAEIFPDTATQRCWVHKTMNVLNKLPKSLQPKAKDRLHEIWMADTREHANKAFDLFLATYQDKYPKAAQCLRKDRESLLAFYDFPAQHWHHIRTTNPIESTFATIKLRTHRTKGCLSRETGLAMLYKLAMSAQDRWPRLRGSKLTADVLNGVSFKNGIKLTCAA